MLARDTNTQIQATIPKLEHKSPIQISVSSVNQLCLHVHFHTNQPKIIDLGTSKASNWFTQFGLFGTDVRVDHSNVKLQGSTCHPRVASRGRTEPRRRLVLAREADTKFQEAHLTQRDGSDPNQALKSSSWPQVFLEILGFLSFGDVWGRSKCQCAMQVPLTPRRLNMGTLSFDGHSLKADGEASVLMQLLPLVSIVVIMTIMLSTLGVSSCSTMCENMVLKSPRSVANYPGPQKNYEPRESNIIICYLQPRREVSSFDSCETKFYQQTNPPKTLRLSHYTLAQHFHFHILLRTKLF